MSDYGWIIDVDHIANPEAAAPSYSNAVGIIGPHDIPDELETRLKAGEGDPFRIYDDDGELYYEGRIVGDGGFQPLDDFGTPNAGATEIRYFVAGRWVML